jgi:hypothetical protein
LLCRGKETTGGWLHLENDVEGIDQSLLQEETDRWEEVLYRYARLMLCDEDAVLGVIETEGGGDWILAVGVWGIWADINMTRDRDGETGWEEGGLRSVPLDCVNDFKERSELTTWVCIIERLLTKLREASRRTMMSLKNRSCCRYSTARSQRSA